MKILSPGFPPQDKVYTVTCSHCNCRFEFKRGEAKYNSDQREGDFLSIKCPQEGCNRTVTVEVK